MVAGGGRWNDTCFFLNWRLVAVVSADLLFCDGLEHVRHIVGGEIEIAILNLHPPRVLVIGDNEARPQYLR